MRFCLFVCSLRIDGASTEQDDACKRRLSTNRPSRQMAFAGGLRQTYGIDVRCRVTAVIAIDIDTATYIYIYMVIALRLLMWFYIVEKTVRPPASRKTVRSAAKK